MFLGASPAVIASQQDCSEPFFGGRAPTLLNAKLREKTRELRFSQFTLLHSGVTRGPLWSAEDLSRANLMIAVSLPRPSSNTFHEETLLPPDERSTLDDYRRSGFDRGHMTPNSDMSNPQAQQESFTLANIVPQDPCNNEMLWEGVESAIRAVALGEGELDSLKGRVIVPTHIFKAVYIPSRDEAGAYWAPNDDSQNWEAISVSKLRDLTGIDPQPLPKASRRFGAIFQRRRLIMAAAFEEREARKSRNPPSIGTGVIATHPGFGLSSRNWACAHRRLRTQGSGGTWKNSFVGFSHAADWLPLTGRNLAGVTRGFSPVTRTDGVMG